MITHSPEEAKLLSLPEGTPIRVDGHTGILAFAPYPENYNAVREVMEKRIQENMFDDQPLDYVEDELITYLLEKLSREGEREVDNTFKKPSTYIRLTLEEVQMYDRYRNSYEFGIEFIQEKDLNISPRNIGKPMIRKGTAAVCFEYPANMYEIINPGA